MCRSPRALWGWEGGHSRPEVRGRCSLSPGPRLVTGTTKCPEAPDRDAFQNKPHVCSTFSMDTLWRL